MSSVLHTVDTLIRTRRLPWTLEDNDIRVSLGSGRRHQLVRVLLAGSEVVFSSVILGTAAVTRSNRRWRELALLAWYRNANTEMVTFCFDESDRLIGRVVHPAATLDPEEAEIYVTSLARECDRLEYLLSGRDEQ